MIVHRANTRRACADIQHISPCIHFLDIDRVTLAERLVSQDDKTAEGIGNNVPGRQGDDQEGYDQGNIEGVCICAEMGQANAECKNQHEEVSEALKGNDERIEALVIFRRFQL